MLHILLPVLYSCYPPLMLLFHDDKCKFSSFSFITGDLSWSGWGTRCACWIFLVEGSSGSTREPRGSCPPPPLALLKLVKTKMVTICGHKFRKSCAPPPLLDRFLNPLVDREGLTWTRGRHRVCLPRVTFVHRVPIA